MSLRQRILDLSNKVYVYLKDNRYKCLACDSAFVFNDITNARAHLATTRHRGLEAIKTVANMYSASKIAAVPLFAEGPTDLPIKLKELNEKADGVSLQVRSMVDVVSQIGS